MIEQQIKIIVISQEAKLPHRIERFFPHNDVSVRWEPNLDQVLNRFELETYDVLVITSDAFKSGKSDGMELLELIAAKCPVTQILFLVEPDDIQMGISALKAGTYQYAKLPASDEEMKLLIKTSLEQKPRYGTNQLLKSAKNDEGEEYKEILGRSSVMQEVYRQIRQAASTDIPVMLEGETGTGKDLVARAIHRQSGRQDKPFIPVNLGALPPELVGSELFGHEKGAFTGAVEKRPGKFEQGHLGTVFLDEIGTISEKVQVSLLRLIEQNKYYRLGGKRPVSVNVRLITATNEDLSTLVQKGTFREDLFYRMDVFRIVLPPLWQRQSDLSILIDEFLRRYNRSLHKNILGIAPECVSLLGAYEWPGNVRELKNVIQRAVLICDGEVLLPKHLPPRFRQDQPGGSIHSKSFGPSASSERMDVSDRKNNPKVEFKIGTPLHEMEQKIITRTLAATKNNRKRAAELLGISRRTLYNKLRKYNID